MFGSAFNTLYIKWMSGGKTYFTHTNIISVSYIRNDINKSTEVV